MRFLGGSAAAEGCLEQPSSATLARDAMITWPLAAVKGMHRRRHLLEHSALELFDDAGNAIMLNIRTKKARTAVRRQLKRRCTLEYRDRDRKQDRAGFRTLMAQLQEQWHNRELSNFEYLMRLNELAGRTHNDLNQ